MYRSSSECIYCTLPIPGAQMTFTLHPHCRRELEAIDPDWKSTPWGQELLASGLARRRQLYEEARWVSGDDLGEDVIPTPLADAANDPCADRLNIIRTLHAQGLGSRRIHRKLVEIGTPISRTTVLAALRKIKQEAQS